MLGATNAKRHAVDQFHGMLGWPLPHSQPFRDLLAHQAVLEPPGMRRPEIGNSGTLTEPLADSRITHPSAAHALRVRPHPGLADGTGVDERKNPTGSHAYQATRGWNPDG